MSIVVVTGTGTGVGKTIAAAALTAAMTAAGRQVAVVKPAQTGGDDEPGDVAVVGALTACTSLHELLRLADPLAPDTAARLRGVLLPPVASLAARTLEIAAGHDVTVVEGAGGVAVRLDTSGGTILTLARHLAAGGHAPRVVIVTSLALGTLNHTELTVEAVRSAGFEPAGLILGSVPDQLGLAQRCNIDELPRVTGLPVVARLPAGIGTWDATRFQAESSGWFDLDQLLTAPANGYW